MLQMKRKGYLFGPKRSPKDPSKNGWDAKTADLARQRMKSDLVKRAMLL